MMSASNLLPVVNLVSDRVQRKTEVPACASSVEARGMISNRDLANKSGPFHLTEDISCCAGDSLELKSNPDVPLAAANATFEVSIAGFPICHSIQCFRMAPLVVLVL